jgi:hypothetical protein
MGMKTWAWRVEIGWKPQYWQQLPQVFRARERGRVRHHHQWRNQAGVERGKLGPCRSTPFGKPSQEESRGGARSRQRGYGEISGHVRQGTAGLDRQTKRSAGSVLVDTHTMSRSANRQRSGMESKRVVEEVKGVSSPTHSVCDYAPTGNVHQDVTQQVPSMSTNALDVGRPSMEPMNALLRRRAEPLSPYRAEAWELELERAGLLGRYPNLVYSLRYGFDIGFPSIIETYTPPNHASISAFTNIFQESVNHELQLTRYLGPFTLQQIVNSLGPVQTSPIAIIPKPHKPGAFWIIQNFSYPHSKQ